MSQMTEDDIALAGEYALGLLDDAAQAQADARAAKDTAFAQEIENWRIYLAPMLDGIDEPVPSHIWPLVNNALPETNNAQDNQKRPHFWRNASFIGGGIAAALAAIVYLQTAPNFQPAEEAGTDVAAEAAADSNELQSDAAAAPALRREASSLAAAVVSEDGKYQLTARYDRASNQMLLNAQSLDIAPLYPEVWIVPEDGKARSLGMIAAKGETRLTIAADMRQFIYDGAAVVITPEPQGGAPGGVATGPAIAIGKLQQS
ncbi:anti-sigma factor domain-containing protein [Sphingorhabdus arenilitoris]|uniref:Anti-sigma factor domain-containing protein n=1 Tax=Sphingorhabdus arenilitoris TaxID=1490041 RepID=A0ABV8RFV0_9SPHN